ncbi:hypothetical protein ACIA8O_00330 [Kitasatospora sp. NPDC051853]|uniref:hypothetical protein n=1 Tax=Kitasatospora sp. NPDC051853 TaxID=3364058 RepID=UPI0037BDD632
MGIEIELHSSRPSKKWDPSRETLIKGSYQHGAALAGALGLLNAKEPGKLPWVDPYGDTMFNEQEAEAALTEIPGLLRRVAGPGQEAAVHDLAELLALCAATPGSYLWFMGD